jgi:hypothetical protein
VDWAEQVWAEQVWAEQVCECIRGKYLRTHWRHTRGHAEQFESALRDSKRVWRLEVELLNVPFNIKCTDLQTLTVDFL